MKNLFATDYECYILKLKQVKNKKSNSYKLVSEKYFPSISIAGGMYESGECMMIGTYKEGFYRKYVSIKSEKASEIIGISDVWYGQLTFCVIKPKSRKIKEKIEKDQICLFNSPVYIETVSNKCKVSSYLLDELLELYKSGKFKNDQGLSKSLMFGPLSRMIKGYKQVKSGKVQSNDYYWDDNHGNGNFTRCDVSFSPLQVGKKIEKKRLAYVYPKKTTYFYYYNEFIIRKIK